MRAAAAARGMRSFSPRQPVASGLRDSVNQYFYSGGRTRGQSVDRPALNSQLAIQGYHGSRLGSSRVDPIDGESGSSVPTRKAKSEGIQRDGRRWHEAEDALTVFFYDQIGFFHFQEAPESRIGSNQPGKKGAGKMRCQRLGFRGE